MSESVEQAALRRADSIDWRRRAEREATVLLDSIGLAPPFKRDVLIQLFAIAWLQGVNLGAHETLHAAEAAFESARATL